MSIATVRLPDKNIDEYESSSSSIPPPPRLRVPKRENFQIEQSSVIDPFQIKDDNDDNTLKPTQGLDYSKLGLPPLSFESDPFLSPINNITFAVERKRIWVRGIKGVKFFLSIQGSKVLVAKRKIVKGKRSWFISRSESFSLDTPDIVGVLVQKKSAFTLFGTRERQTDRYKPIIAGITFSPSKQAVLGKDLWVPKDKDCLFDMTLTPENSIYLADKIVDHDVESIKNGCFTIHGSDDIVYLAKKQIDKSVVVKANNPFSLAAAFGLTIAHFMQ